jgi:hypothetical protein
MQQRACRAATRLGWVTAVALALCSTKVSHVSALDQPPPPRHASDWMATTPTATVNAETTEESEDDRPLIALTYTLGFPSANLRSFIDDMSPRGFEYAMHIPLRRGWHLGATAGYNRFYQGDGPRTYHLPNADATGTVYRGLTAVTLALSTRYYFMAAARPLRAYLGLRTGILFADSTLFVADFNDYTSRVGFLLAPEAGLSVRLLRWLDAVASYQYNFSTASFNDVDRASYHAVQLGLQLRY